MSLLSKFPVRERLALIRKSFKWYRTVKTAYRDYRDGGIRGADVSASWSGRQGGGFLDT